MLLTRIRLRNYRVFEDELDLELPPGLVGVYGPNGSGKSTLIEAIRFTLYGRTRTSLDEVRTTGVNDDCRTEVDFEHEGHRYSVRRTISGVASTVRASAHADGLQVAEGARDTGRYVHSVLGMDDGAFRASVFAEQKQLAAFSLKAPAERRKLVLSLLGITPVDAARDRARREAREAAAAHDRLRDVLGDPSAADDDVATTGEAAAATAARVAEAAAARDQARAAEEREGERFEALDARRRHHERFTAERAAAAEEVDGRRRRLARLEAEVALLAEAEARLASLGATAEALPATEARLRAVEAVVAARLALAGLAPAPEPPEPDEDALERARAALDAARNRRAELEGRARAAADHLARAERAVADAEGLTEAEACPLCGQDLGDAFTRVRSHRRDDLEEARRCRQVLEAEEAEARRAEAEAHRRDRAAADALRSAREAWGAYERARDRRAEAEAVLARAEADLGDRPLADGEVEVLVARRRDELAAAAERERLRGRLERRGALEVELDDEARALASASGRLADLEQRLGDLGFDPAGFAAARGAARQRRQEAEAAAEALGEAQVAEARARTAAEAAVRRRDELAARQGKVAELADDARHRARTAELLSQFRNAVVGTVGPQLSAQAADLFGELTDREYDHLEVDADSYEIKILDEGRAHGMDRFSGSETDLANLALRVAISEHVRFQAGGSVGLLVLDEVFGALDEDRKGRMLLALERLRGRFRQVLVITHDAGVKEQLPHAVEVVKLAGRTATARLLQP